MNPIAARHTVEFHNAAREFLPAAVQAKREAKPPIKLEGDGDGVELP